jgi:pimeloyl-ACP methyl ester carboxylesterase
VTERLTTYAHDGLVFDVVDDGPVDGPVAVLLHGFPQRATSWQQVAPLMHAAGVRTVAPDQRGYSPGARPRGRSSYRMSRLVGDVVALVETLGRGRVHLVGHDWGAAVAWALAATRPDTVATLTSVSVPHPGAMVRSLRHVDQLRRSWYMGFFQLPWLPERVLSSRRTEVERALRAGGMPTDAVARVWPEIVQDGALSGALNWYRAMPLSDRHLLRGRVRVPTTHVWSDGDVALGRAGADLTGAYVDAPYRLEVLEGLSHWIPDEAPERLAEIVLERVAI